MGKDLSRRHLLEAVRRSRRRDTCSEPHRWRPDNPTIGHCDVSSFVLWEHLGGDLVLAQMSVGGESTKHHDRNRFGGADLDVARGQCADGSEESCQVGVHSGDEIAAGCSPMQPELAARLAAFRARVTAGLDANATPVVR